MWPTLYELHYTRLPCPLLSPGVCPNLCPLNQFCHPTISSSVTLFSYPQSFPATGSFLMSQPLNQVDKVLEFQLQDQSFQQIFRVDFFYNWLAWSVCSPRDSRVFSNTTIWKPQFFRTQPSSWTLYHGLYTMVFIPWSLYLLYTMTTGKIIGLARWTFVGKVMSLPINTLSMFVINFLPSSKCLLIS